MAIKQYIAIFTISILSIIFGLYLSEFYFLFNQNLSKKKIHKEYNEATGKKFDTRFFTEVFKEMEKKNKKLATASVTPSAFLRDDNINILPLSGLSNSLTLNCNENGYYSTFKSDKYGFNNPNEIWENKKLDLVLLGDSFVMGNCVNKPNDLKSTLKKNFNSIINLGYSGNGPLLQFSTLKEYMPVGVERVLWFFYEGNDLEDLNIEKNNKLLIKYFTNENFTQNLKMNQNKIDQLNQLKTINRIRSSHDWFIEREKNSYKIKEFLKLRNVRNIFLGYFKNEEKDLDLFIKVIKESKLLAEKKGAKFYFIYLPEISRYKNFYLDDVYDRITTLLDKNNIPLIDIKDIVFDNETDPLILFPFRSKGHYNNLGYKKVGNAITNYLIND